MSIEKVSETAVNREINNKIQIISFHRNGTIMFFIDWKCRLFLSNNLTGGSQMFLDDVKSWGFFSEVLDNDT